MMPPGKELQEKDFISNSLRKNPLPAWVVFIVILCLIALFWGARGWYSQFMTAQVEKNPFLQVTNRQLSILLWQFPERMRTFAKSKAGYLPGFQYENKLSLVLSESDAYAIAPPEVLFLYHTWSRLLKDEFVYRSISPSDFKEFLEYAEEWQPKNWPKAPRGYTSTVEGLFKGSSVPDLNTLSEAELPLEVRQAFQGWMNFFKEGEVIAQFKPTYKQVKQFLAAAPHYSRNYWRNILESSIPNYLISAQSTGADENESVKPEELAAFLKLAIYNFLQAHAEPATKKP